MYVSLILLMLGTTAYTVVRYVVFGDDCTVTDHMSLPAAWH